MTHYNITQKGYRAVEGAVVVSKGEAVFVHLKEGHVRNSIESQIGAQRVVPVDGLDDILSHGGLTLHRVCG